MGSMGSVLGSVLNVPGRGNPPTATAGGSCESGAAPGAEEEEEDC